MQIKKRIQLAKLLLRSLPPVRLLLNDSNQGRTLKLIKYVSATLMGCFDRTAADTTWWQRLFEAWSSGRDDLLFIDRCGFGARFSGHEVLLSNDSCGFGARRHGTAVDVLLLIIDGVLGTRGVLLRPFRGRGLSAEWFLLMCIFRLRLGAARMKLFMLLLCFFDLHLFDMRDREVRLPSFWFDFCC